MKSLLQEIGALNRVERELTSELSLLLLVAGLLGAILSGRADSL